MPLTPFRTPSVYARHIRRAGRAGVLASAVALAALTSLVNAPAALASPPTPISAAEARAYLATVTPAAEC